MIFYAPLREKMTSPNSISLRKIAARAGCSHSTVSRALKNHSSIPPLTCRRIQKLAEKMGHRPSPLITALMTQIRKKRRVSYVSTIAWINHIMSKDAKVHSKYMEGATEQADRLGYQIEKFWLHEPGMSVERLDRIFLARNIRGLMIPPYVAPNTRWPFQWEHFVSVTIGRSSSTPGLHCVSPDIVHSMALCIQTLRRKGYRRIGYVTSPWIEVVSGGNYTARFLHDWYHMPVADRVPPLNLLLNLLNLPMQTKRGRNKHRFGQWLKKYRPEILICFHGRYKTWLEMLGYSIPQDIGIARFCLHPTREFPTGYWSGIIENEKQIGMVAVNQLVSLLQNNEIGIPPLPTVTLVKGGWFDGKTVVDCAV